MLHYGVKKARNPVVAFATWAYLTTAGLCRTLQECGIFEYVDYEE